MILQVTKGTGNFQEKMVPLPKTNSEFIPENGMFGIRSFPLGMTYFHWKSGCHNLEKKTVPSLLDDEKKNMEEMGGKPRTSRYPFFRVVVFVLISREDAAPLDPPKTHHCPSE